MGLYAIFMVYITYSGFILHIQGLYYIFRVYITYSGYLAYFTQCGKNKCFELNYLFPYFLLYSNN